MAVPISVCHHLKDCQSEISLKFVETGEVVKIDTIPLDGFVADDDGWEEEHHRGTAHRSKHYNVHLHPPGAQQGHPGLGLFGREREEGKAGETFCTQKQRMNLAEQNQKNLFKIPKHLLWFQCDGFGHNTDTNLVITSLVIVLYNTITEQRRSDFSFPAFWAWKKLVSSPCSVGFRFSVQRYTTWHHETFKVPSAFLTPALLLTPITVAGTSCSIYIGSVV